MNKPIKIDNRTADMLEWEERIKSIFFNGKTDNKQLGKLIMKCPCPIVVSAYNSVESVQNNDPLTIYNDNSISITLDIN